MLNLLTTYGHGPRGEVSEYPFECPCGESYKSESAARACRKCVKYRVRCAECSKPLDGELSGEHVVCAVGAERARYEAAEAEQQERDREELAMYEREYAEWRAEREAEVEAAREAEEDALWEYWERRA
jgi:hypothetical protein